MSGNHRYPPCTRCRAGFSSNRDRRSHLLQDRFNHPFYCTRCDKLFTSKEEQIEHVKTGLQILMEPTTTQAGQIRCSVCRAGFAGMSVLQSHLASAREHPYSCPSCALDFHNQVALNQHRADVHSMLRSSSPTSSPSTSTNDDLQHPSALPDITWTDEEPTWGFPETLTRPPPPPSNAVRLQPMTQISLEDLESESEEDDVGQAGNLGLDPWHLRSTESSYRSIQNSYASHLQRNVHRTVSPRRSAAQQRNELATNLSSGRVHSFAVALASQDTHNRGASSRTSSALPSAQVAPKSTISEPPRKCAFPIPCPLCLDLASDLTTTLCGHVGCKMCLIQSLREKQECPICRKPATERQLHPIFL